VAPDPAPSPCILGAGRPTGAHRQRSTPSDACRWPRRMSDDKSCERMSAPRRNARCPNDNIPSMHLALKHAPYPPACQPRGIRPHTTEREVLPQRRCHWPPELLHVAKGPSARGRALRTSPGSSLCAKQRIGRSTRQRHQALRSAGQNRQSRPPRGPQRRTDQNTISNRHIDELRPHHRRPSRGSRDERSKPHWSPALLTGLGQPTD
jgi:hypothetical protein